MLKVSASLQIEFPTDVFRVRFRNWRGDARIARMYRDQVEAAPHRVTLSWEGMWRDVTTPARNCQRCYSRSLHRLSDRLWVDVAGT